MLMEFAMIMTIVQMLVLQLTHSANPSLNNVCQQIQLAELLLNAINMKISTHAPLVLIILYVDGYLKINAKNTQYAVMQQVLSYQLVPVGVLHVFQMEPNVSIKELVLHI